MVDFLAAFKEPSKAQFLRAFNRLCVALRETPDDSGITQGIYFEALKDLPVEVVELAATALARDMGRRFFPTTAEWRDVACRLQQDHLRAALSGPRVWHHDCDECEDTGWKYFDCAGDNFCGRENRHAPHTCVRICLCRATNRTYQRHVASERIRG